MNEPARTAARVVVLGLVCAAAVEIYALYQHVDGIALAAFMTFVGGAIGFHFSKYVRYGGW